MKPVKTEDQVVDILRKAYLHQSLSNFGHYMECVHAP